MINFSFEVLAIAEHCFAKYIADEHALTEKIRMGDDREYEEESRLLTMKDGLAIIEIKGGLTARDSYFNRYYGMVSYNEIRTALVQAMQKNASAILMDFNSPGGAVSGLRDTADLISRMPVKTIAFASGNMSSAAYFLGSQADYVYASDFGEVGSIGVVVKTYDRSKMLADLGVKPIRFRSGKLKASGDPDFKLTDEEKAYIQGQVQLLANKFYKIVSDARGITIPQMESFEITTGKTFIGEEAIAVKLVDKVMSFDQSMIKAFDLVKKVDRSPLRSIRY